MKERIKAIMDAEDMTPARFADTLEIGRAVISHILNGRNNPSLDVITRILSKLPQINSDWLLTGNGSMYKIDNNRKELEFDSQGALFPDLFTQNPSQNLVNTPNVSDENEYRKEKVVNETLTETQESINERIIYKEAPSKKIRQIIIYYTDNTFETFNRE